MHLKKEMDIDSLDNLFRIMFYGHICKLNECNCKVDLKFENVEYDELIDSYIFTYKVIIIDNLLSVIFNISCMIHPYDYETSEDLHFIKDDIINCKKLIENIFYNYKEYVKHYNDRPHNYIFHFNMATFDLRINISCKN